MHIRNPQKMLRKYHTELEKMRTFVIILFLLKKNLET
jgi:hypothetical protein